MFGIVGLTIFIRGDIQYYLTGALFTTFILIDLVIHIIIFYVLIKGLQKDSQRHFLPSNIGNAYNNK